MEKILITGITGFVGSHMADYLLTFNNIKVFGIKRWSSRLRNVSHLLDRVTPIDCDITDYTSVRNVLEKIHPDRIFHFAAQSFVSPSWEMPASTLITNIIGTLNFLEVMRHLALDSRFLVSGSGEEYGLIYEHELPITESSPLRPVNPYAVSKVAQDFLCYEHFLSYGQNIIRTRAFNHEGPRRDKVFALSHFAYQIASIEAGLQPSVIKVGRLTARRNFTDVRDMVKAYHLAMEKCIPGELYLIGSDQVYTIKEALHLLVEISPARDKISIQEDPDLVRLTEVPLLIGDYSKFRKQTGWKPRIPFQKTLEDTLNYWRQFIHKGLY